MPLATSGRVRTFKTLFIKIHYPTTNISPFFRHWQYSVLFSAFIDNYNLIKEFVVIVGFNYGSDAREYFFLRKPEISPEQAFTIVSDRPWKLRKF